MEEDYPEGDDEYLDETKQQDIKIITALEEFWSLPNFTEELHKIMEEHAHKFSDSEEEQNIECYAIFKQYTKTIEQLLKSFLEEQSITEEDLYSWWNRVGQYSTDALSWIDYLIATTEYSEFCSMMIEYKQANEWDAEEQQDDFLSSILNMKIDPRVKDSDDL